MQQNQTLHNDYVPANFFIFPTCNSIIQTSSMIFSIKNALCFSEHTILDSISVFSVITSIFVVIFLFAEASKTHLLLEQYSESTFIIPGKNRPFLFYLKSASFPYSLCHIKNALPRTFTQTGSIHSACCKTHCGFHPQPYAAAGMTAKHQYRHIALRSVSASCFCSLHPVHSGLFQSLEAIYR